MADNDLIKKLNSSFQPIEQPEIIEKPESFINTISSKTYKGSKPALAKSILRNGFSIENAANHPNCQSAKYFLNKLQEISNTQ